MRKSIAKVFFCFKKIVHARTRALSVVVCYRFFAFVYILFVLTFAFVVLFGDNNMNCCDKCGKCFQTLASMKRHLNRITPCHKPTHQCNHCNAMFASYQSLWKHKKNCQPASYTPPVSSMTSSAVVHQRPLKGTILSPEESLDLRKKWLEMEEKNKNNNISSIHLDSHSRKSLIGHSVDNNNTPPVYTKNRENLMCKKDDDDEEEEEEDDDDKTDSEADAWIVTDSSSDEDSQTNDTQSGGDLKHLPWLFKQLTDAIIAKDDYTHILDRLLKQNGITPCEYALFRNVLAKQQQRRKIIGRTVYLPSDISGLWEKLKVLAAEFYAGNTTTRNELVAVLDELKRQDGISDEEYTNINTSLGTGLCGVLDDDNAESSNGSGLATVFALSSRKPEDLWGRLKMLTLTPSYLSGNNDTAKRQVLVILNELLKQGEITSDEYEGMMKSFGERIVSDKFTKHSMRNNLNKNFTKRLEKIIETIRETDDIGNLANLIQQYVVNGKSIIRSEIDAILQSLNIKKSAVAEVEMILNRIEYINRAVESFFERLHNDDDDGDMQESDVVLQNMLTRREIDLELLKHIQDIIR